MSHCKKVREARALERRVDRHMRMVRRRAERAWQIITYALPDGTPCTAHRYDFIMENP